MITNNNKQSADSDKKVININPDLFSIKGIKKTRKNKTNTKNTNTESLETLENNIKKPKTLISPILQQKILLKRLNENRNNKSMNLLSSPKLIPNNNLSYTDNIDNFDDSINYLESITAKNSLNKEKEIYEKLKIKKRDEAYRKTLHNPYRLKEHVDDNQNIPPLIEIELPKDNNTISIKNIYSNSSIPSYNVDNELPYGVLKSGIKPTYKYWKKTQKNSSRSSFILDDDNEQYDDNYNKDKLEHLRETIKKKQNEYKNLVPSILTSSNLNSKNTENEQENYDINPSLDIKEPQLNNTDFDANNIYDSLHKNQVNTLSSMNDSKTDKQNDDNNDNDNDTLQKKLLKKTIKRKFLLGRNKHKNIVSVLIKNSNTRKNIITAKRQLKSQPISEIKKYLKAHNLIKFGDNAPNDVLRTLYENSILAGDITNVNSKTLLHNFKNEL